MKELVELKDSDHHPPISSEVFVDVASFHMRSFQLLEQIMRDLSECAPAVFLHLVVTAEMTPHFALFFPKTTVQTIHQTIRENSYRFQCDLRVLGREDSGNNHKFDGLSLVPPSDHRFFWMNEPSIPYVAGS